MAAERLGFDCVFLSEHHFTAYNLLPSPNVMLGALAARTERIRLGVMVNVVPFHEPLRLAEEAAMLDVLSGGRLEVGVGRGIDFQEVQKLGMDFDELRPRFQEGMELMPSIKVVPASDGSRVGYAQVQSAFGAGAPGTLQLVGPRDRIAGAASIASNDPELARVLPPQQGSGGLALVQAVPAADPSDPSVGATIDRLRRDLPAGVFVGGAVAENDDLESALAAKTPLVIGVVLALGFLLLLLALQAPLIAALGVLTNLLAVGAAFGVGRLIFQGGHGAGLLGFESQGFMDAWAPVFFFAMVFAISMDYTVFLLSSAKEHYDRSGDPKEAAVGGLAHSGRVIFAAAAVMVAVFFTFALSGPLPPKEMGVILGIAVLLDAMLIRLVLMPTLLRVFGHRAWALPAWLDRILPDIRFGHA